jgi:hypothetical protein
VESLGEKLRGGSKSEDGTHNTVKCGDVEMDSVVRQPQNQVFM